MIGWHMPGQLSQHITHKCSGLSGFYHYHKRCYVLSRRHCQSAKVFGIQDESPKTFEIPSSYVTVKRFDKISLNFSSSSFVIRVNLLHPCPSLYLDCLLLSLWCFSIFVQYYFQVSFNLMLILSIMIKMTQNTVTEVFLKKSLCA